MITKITYVSGEVKKPSGFYEVPPPLQQQTKTKNKKTKTKSEDHNNIEIHKKMNTRENKYI